MEIKRTVIYQVLPRLFGNSNLTNKISGTIEENGCGKLNDFTPEALNSIRKLGATHVWFTGILEHATQTDYSKYGIARDCADVVKGKAGSPYAIKDYYDIDPDLAVDVPNRMAEFEALIERTHCAGMKVIIDLVPNHVARQYVSDSAPSGTIDFGVNDNTTLAFSKQNNFYYIPGETFKSPDIEKPEPHWHEYPARATGNDCFSATPSITDWYETVKLNYGVDYLGGASSDFKVEPDTWLKMRDIVLFWAGKGVDGFRCDMAGMVPIEFWHWLTSESRQKYPHLMFIAEVYDASLYNDFIFKGGFDYLYDKVIFYDGLRAILEGKAPAHQLTTIWQQTEGLHHFLLYFLENHDEQRLASDFFVGNGLKAVPGMVVAATMFNNPLLIYSGQELGEQGMNSEGFSGLDGRTTIFDYWGLELFSHWHGNGSWSETGLMPENRKLRNFYSKLLNLLQTIPALHKGRFYDLMWANKDNQFFNSDKLFTFFRYHEKEVYLVIANFSDEIVSYKLKIPVHAMQTAGLKTSLFFKGIDLLGNCKNIQFPGEVAINGGFGGGINARCAAVYKIELHEL